LGAPVDENLILCHLHRVDYKHCSEKFLVDVNNNPHSISTFPIFTKKKNFDSYFNDPNYHINFGAARTELEDIPIKFKDII